MRFTDDSPSWCYLPPELLRHVLHFVDDWDIRIHFGFIEKLESHRYDAVRYFIRNGAYYRFQCVEACLQDCKKHRHGVNFNPITTPTITNPPARHLCVPPHLFDRIMKNPKITGPWKKFSLTFPLSGYVEDEKRAKSARGRANDILMATIVQFEDCVTYNIGVWRIKRKNGEGAKEGKHIYYLDGLSPDTYFTDFLEWTFDVV